MSEEWTRADDLIHDATMELREFLKRCRFEAEREKVPERDNPERDIRLAQDALTRLLDYRDLRDKETG